ncbi:MAG: hypothetical protein JKY19_08705 [Alcanivoracaceae bacterium]|nr:hypothetical protein [Alcanivoracaceae bacterium]
MKIKLMTSLVLSLMTIIGLSEESNTNIAHVSYEITKHIISSGGGEVSGGGYAVTSSIGQADAGHDTSGGGYEFNGGLLSSNSDLIFKNGYE